MALLNNMKLRSTCYLIHITPLCRRHAHAESFWTTRPRSQALPRYMLCRRSLASVCFMPAKLCETIDRACASESTLIALETPTCNDVDLNISLFHTGCKFKLGNGVRQRPSSWSHRKQSGITPVWSSGVADAMVTKREPPPFSKLPWHIWHAGHVCSSI